MRCWLLAVVVAGSSFSPLAAADNELTEPEKKDGWVLLFNGKDLNGFQSARNAYVNHGKWIVEDGTINLCLFGGMARYVPPLHLLTEREFENYVLKFDFKTDAKPGNCHSGVILKIGNPKDTETSTLEVAIYGAGQKPGHYCTGCFRHDLQAPRKNAMKAPGEWNTFEITVNRNLVKVDLNGETVNELDLKQWDKPGVRPDGTAHKMTKMALTEMPARSRIGFREDHGTPIWYRNIKLKPLE